MDPETMARAELREETGVTAREMRHIGRLHPSYGLCSHAFDVFLATGLSEGAPAREAEEQDMVSRRFPLAEVLRMVREGEIRDACSIAALSLLDLQGCLKFR
jgi:ADP-ribose pyrophosphatase